MTFFLDIYGDHVLSAIALNVATSDTPAGRIVANGTFSARRNSWLLNCIQPYWSAVTLVMQKLRELNEHGWDRFARIAPIGERKRKRCVRARTRRSRTRTWLAGGRPGTWTNMVNRPREAIESHWRIAPRVGKSPSLADSAKPGSFGLPPSQESDRALLRRSVPDTRSWQALAVLRRLSLCHPDTAFSLAQKSVRGRFGGDGAARSRTALPSVLPVFAPANRASFAHASRDAPHPHRRAVPLRPLPGSLGARQGVASMPRRRQHHLQARPDFIGCSPASWNPTPTVASCTCFIRAHLFRGWTSHPANPLSSDIRFNRGAGAIVSRQWRR